MQVSLLYFDGCPNWQETEQRLLAVLVDGRDPFASPGDPVGLSCRVFRTPAGLRGAPTVEQLRQALGAG